MSHSSIYTVYIFIFSMCLGISLHGQIDGHYWTNQYGAKGLLMNGAVLANPDDETSIFYNPGAMPLDDNLGFAFSFLTPTFSRLTTNNFLGDGEELRDEDFGFSPGFLAVRFKPFDTDRFVMGFATFERFVTDLKFEDRVVGQLSSNSNLLFRGDLEFVRKISQDWVGLGFSFKITDHFGIGVTQFSVWHSENLDFDFKKEIVQSASTDQVVQSWRSAFDYDYSIYSSFITKFGMSVQFDQFCLGLVYTTPSYSPIRSSASYAFEDQKLFDDGSSTSASNRSGAQVNDFQTAKSLGGGLEIHLDKISLNFSAEWFEAVPSYTAFENQDDTFDGLSEGESEESISIQTGNESVFNFAVGLQNQIGKNTRALFGFRTDFNQSNFLEINNTAEYLASTPDIYHFSGGIMYQYRKNIFSFGLDVGLGRRGGGQQLLDLSNTTTENLFENSSKMNVNNQFGSVMLFITYDFLFGD